MVNTHPVQVNRSTKTAQISTAVTLRAYEVYRKLHGEQPALIEGWCRGGFGAGELIAYLYAYPFPKNEWQKRFDEALENMQGL